MNRADWLTNNVKVEEQPLGVSQEIYTPQLPEGNIGVWTSRPVGSTWPEGLVVHADPHGTQWQIIYRRNGVDYQYLYNTAGDLVLYQNQGTPYNHGLTSVTGLSANLPQNDPRPNQMYPPMSNHLDPFSTLRDTIPTPPTVPMTPVVGEEPDESVDNIYERRIQEEIRSEIQRRAAQRRDEENVRRRRLGLVEERQQEDLADPYYDDSPV